MTNTETGTANLQNLQNLQKLERPSCRRFPISTNQRAAIEPVLRCQPGQLGAFLPRYGLPVRTNKRFNYYMYSNEVRHAITAGRDSAVWDIWDMLYLHCTPRLNTLSRVYTTLREYRYWLDAGPASSLLPHLQLPFRASPCMQFSSACGCGWHILQRTAGAISPRW